MMWRNKRGQDAKMGNQRCTCSLGHSHRSKLERAVCQILQLRERAGEISIIQVEDRIKLSGWYTYVADFKCLTRARNQLFWVEAKGHPSARWPSTKKGWKFAGPGPLEIWGGSYAHPKLIEVIVPTKEVL